MQNTLYDILGIPTSATKEEIKIAFKLLAKKFHPDKNPGNSLQEERFKEINHAYQVLSNEIAKQKYDYQLEYIAFQKKKTTSSPAQKKNTPTPSNQKKTSTTYTTPKKKNSSLNTNLVVLGFFAVMGVLTYFVYTFMSKYTAEDLFEKAEILSIQGRHKDAFMLYTDALSYYKEYAEAYEKRGTARILAIKDFKGAEQDFTNAIIYSDKPSVSLYFKRVKCHIKLNQYNSALIDLDSILSINQMEDSAFYYKAEINYTEDNFQSAITHYTSFIHFNPKATDAFLKRGFCFLKMRDDNNALTDFNTVISLNPQEIEAYYYRGITYHSLNDTSKACSDLNYAYIIGFSDAKALIDKYCLNP